MKKVNILFSKTMFPEEIFKDLNTIDGIIALIFFIFYLVITSFSLYLVKISQLFNLIKGHEKNFYSVLFIVIMDLPAIITILIILKIRKQKIDTIGLRKRGIKSTLFVGVTLFSLYLMIYFTKHRFNCNFISGLLFYLVFVGFFEEIVFRGFLWNRLVILFGRAWGTITSGLMFGFIHIPIDIVWNKKSLYEAVFWGSTSNISILAGVLYTLLFVYIYTRNKNIILPSFIHGMLDLSSTI